MKRKEEMSVSDSKTEIQSPARYLHELKEVPEVDEREIENKTSQEIVPSLGAKPDQQVSGKKKTVLKDIPHISHMPRIFGAREYILITVNIFSFFSLMFLLFTLPKQAQSIQTKEQQKIGNEASRGFAFTEIENLKRKSDQLASLFLDEEGIVQFVGEVEKIKADNPSLIKFSFPSPRSIKDKTGNFAIPVLIEFKGSWDDISEALNDIEALPYLLRTVSFESIPDPIDESKIVVKYGGALYVYENFSTDK